MGRVRQLWALSASSPRSIARAAERAEEAGWDGLAVVDSQNLAGDSYVALTIAAAHSQRLGLGTAVTNPVTRHPAVTASAIASVHAHSGGRATLGIGRGDSSLAHLGRAPASVGTLERYLEVLQAYLRGERVPFDALDFHERAAPPVADLDLADTPANSGILWLDRSLPKVQVEVAATGPRVIGLAARHADRVMFALGADPERIRWGMRTARDAREKAGLDRDDIAFGAYANLVCHPELARARELVSGGLTTFARFAVMHGEVAGPATDEQRQVFQGLHDSYDMKQHTRAGSPQARALTDEFIDRYAIVGPASHCVERLAELFALGLSRIVLIGPTAGADREQARRAEQALAAEVLPGFADPHR